MPLFILFSNSLAASDIYWEDSIQLFGNPNARRELLTKGKT